jgi:hypothetical protein
MSAINTIWVHCLGAEEINPCCWLVSFWLLWLELGECDMTRFRSIHGWYFFTIGAISNQCKEKGYSATPCSVLVLTMTDYQVTYCIHPYSSVPVVMTETSMIWIDRPRDKDTTNTRHLVMTHSKMR